MMLCQWKPPRLKKTSTSSSSLKTSTDAQNKSAELLYPSLKSIHIDYNITSFPTHAVGENGVECGSIPQRAESYACAEVPLLEADFTGSPLNGSWREDAEEAMQPANSHHSSYELKNNEPAPPAAMSQSMDPRTGVFHHDRLIQPYRFAPPAPMEHSVIGALSQSRLADAAIRQGALDKCKLVDNGVRVKKKEWTSAYAYLYSGHLLFYKDQKSAEVNTENTFVCNP